jgi:hypothetical protein
LFAFAQFALASRVGIAERTERIDAMQKSFRDLDDGNHKMWGRLKLKFSAFEEKEGKEEREGCVCGGGLLFSTDQF